MSRYPGARRHALATGLLLALGTPAWATVAIEPGDCAAPPTLSAQGQPLSVVLQKLSETLGFRLVFRGSRDPLVDLQRQAPLGELLTQLTAAENLITETGPDPACPGQTRINTVLVLPTGDKGERIEAVPEGLQRYRRAHGMDPVTGEPIRKKRRP